MLYLLKSTTLRYARINVTVSRTRVNLDCYNKTFECMDEEGNPRVVRGTPKAISVRQVSTMQLKKFCRKGCRLYAAHVLEARENETPKLKDYHVLQEFRDVFPNEILGLHRMRDIDFTIEMFQEEHRCPRHPTT